MCCEKKKDNCFIIRDFNARLVFYVRSHDCNERERERDFILSDIGVCCVILCMLYMARMAGV